MRFTASLSLAFAIALACAQCRTSDQGHNATPLRTPLALAETTLTIPQVDYESAIYYNRDDPYPHIDFSRVNESSIVDKEHVALVLENEYIRVTLLPEMGRVHSLYYKPTGHDELWRNDTVTVGGAVNDPGWWIWIGGVEYTLPGDEHGTTWSTPWDWQVVTDSPDRKTVRLEVQELGTALRETIHITLYPGKSYYEAKIRISNPTDQTVHYAHWVNPQWTPGGQNELTDSTEFIIPTDRILISPKWQANMGPSPQPWKGNRLRFIKGWDKMGDLMADGLQHGFYGAHSHDANEGVVRVFEEDKTPGVDVWTYGYHPTRIPMGSGSPSKGYVEMWGGTSKLFPDEQRPIAPGESFEWTEWMFPYHGTGGLTFADTTLAVNFKLNTDTRKAIVALCPTGSWHGAAELYTVAEASAESNVIRAWEMDASPTNPFYQIAELEELQFEELTQLRLRLSTDRSHWLTLAPEISGSRQ